MQSVIKSCWLYCSIILTQQQHQHLHVPSLVADYNVNEKWIKAKKKKKLIRVVSYLLLKDNNKLTYTQMQSMQKNCQFKKLLIEKWEMKVVYWQMDKNKKEEIENGEKAKATRQYPKIWL